MRKMIMIDIIKCGGCRTCEMICSWSHNKGEINPRRGRISVVKKEADGINIPFMCLQCDDPYCKKVCPRDAIEIDEKSGAKLVDHDKCIRCKLCMIACPFGGIAFDQMSKEMFKCDLCNDADTPQCVKWCPKEALNLIDLDRVGIIKKQKGVEKLMEISAAASASDSEADTDTQE